MNQIYETRDAPTLCLHDDCGGDLFALPADPCLPAHVRKFECADCGEWFDYDAEDGAVEVDA